MRDFIKRKFLISPCKINVAIYIGIWNFSICNIPLVQLIKNMLRRDSSDGMLRGEKLNNSNARLSLFFISKPGNMMRFVKIQYVRR